MSVTPSADAQALAAAQGAELANLATPITALQTAIANGSLAPAASIDPLLSLGYVALVVNSAGPSSSNTTTSASFVNMPTGASGTFTAPVAKNYEITADFSCFVATSVPTLVAFRFVVNGTPVTPLLMMQVWFNVVNDRRYFSFRQQMPMNAGANTIQMQWAVTSGTGVATFDTASWMAIHASG